VKKASYYSWLGSLFGPGANHPWGSPGLPITFWSVGLALCIRSARKGLLTSPTAVARYGLLVHGTLVEGRDRRHITGPLTDLVCSLLDVVPFLTVCILVLPERRFCAPVTAPPLTPRHFFFAPSTVFPKGFLWHNLYFPVSPYPLSLLHRVLLSLTATYALADRTSSQWSSHVTFVPADVFRVALGFFWPGSCDCVFLGLFFRPSGKAAFCSLPLHRAATPRGCLDGFHPSVACVCLGSPLGDTDFRGLCKRVIVRLRLNMSMGVAFCLFHAFVWRTPLTLYDSLVVHVLFFWVPRYPWMSSVAPRFPGKLRVGN